MQYEYKNLLLMRAVDEYTFKPIFLVCEKINGQRRIIAKFFAEELIEKGYTVEDLYQLVRNTTVHLPENIVKAIQSVL